MLRNLVDWIVEGEEPPAPRYIEFGETDEGKVRMLTDEDGNALGGLRLPHMVSVLPNGNRVGAPLGVYGGVDVLLDRPELGYARLGGTFEPFPREELARRYPTREVYVDLVEKAAAHLLEGRYILEEDYHAYIRTAENVWCTTIAAEPSKDCPAEEAAR
jgi:hypothetical protein